MSNLAKKMLERIGLVEHVHGTSGLSVEMRKPNADEWWLKPKDKRMHLWRTVHFCECGHQIVALVEGWRTHKSAMKIARRVARNVFLHD